MSAPNWGLFLGAVLVLTISVLGLVIASQRFLETQGGMESLGDGGLMLVANVTATQSIIGGLLLGVAWFAGIPWSAFGVDGLNRYTIVVGVGCGLGVYLVSEIGVRVLRRVGIEVHEWLRSLLAPGSMSEWVFLLGIALPVIAGVEELLFRGMLIGAIHTGFNVSDWGLAVISSVVFGVAHGVQGLGGIVMTGVVGFFLAAAFIVTGDLAVVIIAHYFINSLEFVLHEGMELSLRE